MFITDHEKLKEVLHRMQREHCCYDTVTIRPDAKPPSFCDCKYGYDKKPMTEATGCPELRCVVELLTLITEEEYNEIMKRGHHINIGG